jgi:hypothetical protein
LHEKALRGLARVAWFVQREGAEAGETESLEKWRAIARRDRRPQRELLRFELRIGSRKPGYSGLRDGVVKRCV